MPCISSPTFGISQGTSSISFYSSSRVSDPNKVYIFKDLTLPPLLHRYWDFNSSSVFSIASNNHTQKYTQHTHTIKYPTQPQVPLLIPPTSFLLPPNHASCKNCLNSSWFHCLTFPTFLKSTTGNLCGTSIF